MRSRTRAVRYARRASAVAVLVTLLAVVAPATASAAPTHRAPADRAQTHRAAKRSAPSHPAPPVPPLLPIKVRLGTLTVDVSLPLNLSTIITVQSPTPPRSSTAPAPSQTPTKPAPRPVPHAQPTQSQGSVAAAQPIARQQAAAVTARLSHATTQPQQRHTTATTRPTAKPHKAPSGALVLVKQLMPGVGIGLLVVVIVATAIGVAFVVRLNSRRGTHRS